MRLILTLAWRSLWRNRRRALLTLLAVLFPVMILDLMWGLSGAMRRNLFENLTRLETGQLQIHRAGYQELKTGLPLIQDATPVIEALEGDPGIAWFTVRLELPALAANGNRSRGVLVQGVEPGKAAELSLMDEWVRQGRPLRPDDRGVALAGAALLDRLGVSLEEPLLLITSHPQMGTGVLRPRVVGRIQPPSRELSRFIVQVPLADARALVKNPRAATSVVALVRGVSGPWDQARIDAAAQRLQAALGEAFVVETWQQLRPETAALFNLARALYLIFGLVFFLLGGLVVLNTLYLSVLERTRELGVVLALGSSRRRVLSWITVEAALLAGLGSALGSALGGLLVGWGSFGLTLPDFYEEIGTAMGFSRTLFLRITAEEMALSAGMMFAIALLAAAYPAWKAAQLQPVEAMRFAK